MGEGGAQLTRPHPTPALGCFWQTGPSRAQCAAFPRPAAACSAVVGAGVVCLELAWVFVWGAKGQGWSGDPQLHLGGEPIECPTGLL